MAEEKRVYRIAELYKNEVVPALEKKFAYKNINEVPRLDKIVLNMGLGDVKDNSKSLQLAVEELKAIAGQYRRRRALLTSRSEKAWLSEPK